jgi:hypothetical protein
MGTSEDRRLLVETGFKKAQAFQAINPDSAVGAADSNLA